MGVFVLVFVYLLHFVKTNYLGNYITWILMSVKHRTSLCCCFFSANENEPGKLFPTPSFLTSCSVKKLKMASLFANTQTHLLAISEVCLRMQPESGLLRPVVSVNRQSLVQV